MPPAFDEDLCFLACVEELAIEQLIAQLAIEALIIAVLPWAAWFDVECLHANPPQPILYRIGGELSPLSEWTQLGGPQVACAASIDADL